MHRAGSVEPDPLRGLFEVTLDGVARVVEYEPDGDLRDTEQVRCSRTVGSRRSFAGEVLPHAPDAWFVASSIKIGYEISFTRYFYKPEPLRPLDEIRADILALEQETDGLLARSSGDDHMIAGLQPYLAMKPLASSGLATYLTTGTWSPIEPSCGNAKSLWESDTLTTHCCRSPSGA